MDSQAECSPGWWTTVVGFLMFLISEVLGAKNGEGTCSSILQLAVSAYRKFKGVKPEPITIEAPPVKETAEWLK